MKVTVKGDLRACSDCGSSHMGRVPCGLSYMQRLGSTQRTIGWMDRDKTNWFDDEPLKEVWGLDKNERKEDLMEQTGGHGFFDSPKDMTPEAAEYFGFAD